MKQRTVFVLDGLGASVSAILLGLVLPRLQHWIGLPTVLLYVLAESAAVLALYSLSCARFANASDERWLRALVVANLLYCAATAGLVLWFWKAMHPLGFAYFAGEIFIILGLVQLERRVLARRRERRRARLAL